MTYSLIRNFAIDLLDPYLEDKGLIILDGAMGTCLEAKGLNLNNPLWSAIYIQEKPEIILEVHREYLLAGADIITTASYQASLKAFQKQGFDKIQAIEIIQKSVLLALKARDQLLSENLLQPPFPLIAGSIGPYGAYLADGSEYRGDYGISLTDLRKFHEINLSILSETGSDLMGFETIPSLIEARAIVEALKEFPEQKAWISFSCKDSKNISDGESLEKVVREMDKSENLLAIGINCTQPVFIEPLIKLAAKNTSKLIIVYPNRGDHYDPQTKTWRTGLYEMNFVENARSWFQAGARIIGGCCGTSPEDIQDLRQETKRQFFKGN